MSRRDGIENLLAGAPSEVAPTASDIRQQTEKSSKVIEPTSRSASRRTNAEKSLKPRPQEERAKPAAPASQPVRVQISTSDGSEIATALEEIRANIPPEFQKNFNLGAFFRDVLRDNDFEIANMIRMAKEGNRHA